MLKTTLLPLSLNERYQHLSEMAAYLRHFETEKVYLCHILESEHKKEKDKIRSTLEHVAGLMEEQGLSVETVIRRGNVAEKVCRLTTELKVDFISIKWRNKNVIKRSILGSPDVDILRICDVPTLIYKTRPFLQSGSKLRSVLYATDFQETDRKVLPYLQATPINVDTLYLFHVRRRAPDPETDARQLEMVESKLNKLSKECLQSYKKIEHSVATGSVRYQIPRKVRQLNVDLVVIGKRDKMNPLEKIIGSTAESLPHKSRCPVLIIS